LHWHLAVLQSFLHEQVIGVDVEVLSWRAAYAKVIFFIHLVSISKGMLIGKGRSSLTGNNLSKIP